MSIIPLSSVVLTRAEESGEVAGRYGLGTDRCSSPPRPDPGTSPGPAGTSSLAHHLDPSTRVLLFHA